MSDGKYLTSLSNKSLQFVSCDVFTLVEYLTGQQLVFSLLIGVLVVDAVGDLSLEVGQSVSWIRAAGLLPEPRLPDLLQHDPLQVSALLSQQLQLPEVSQPQLTIPVLLATWVTTKHEV